ncbi:PEP-CTERM sorting domain-containing protein [Oopsacas minuta]|uniref:PEP-CTERM sorting domain-containing protein n=1 Tax=Oopsacas minuta TaxID=111878 RepID=A0AAV7JJY8_9METZ|nr:PEP-CTERM sorting domain-containing protein [Oopsacas minuta]
MADNEDYRKVSFVRKLLEKKISKLHDCLDERLKVMSKELDEFEELFESENEKDEAELEKLSQYRRNTIELFNQFDNQVIKIENKIESLENRIESRKLKLEFDDTSLTNQISCFGCLTRMEDKTKNYEVFGSLSSDNLIKYEEIDEEMMDEIRSIKSKSLNNSPSHGETSDHEDTVFKPGEYLKPSRQAPIPPKHRPPVPPTRGKAPKPQHPMSPLTVGKIWKTQSDEYAEINIDDKKQETELYCKVPEGKFQDKAFFRKKSISLSSILNITSPSPGEISNKQDYLITAKCKIGAGPGQMLKPKNIAISPQTGCIFVAEKGNNRIQVFAATGDPMYSFSRKTSTPNHSLIKPYGICILNERVYVSVTQYACVHAYKTNGEFVMQKGIEGKLEGNFEFPTGMNTDGINKIYVCDYGNNRVQAFNKDLQFKQIIGAGRLTNPTDIAVDHNFDLYVLDRSTTIVHHFNSKGIYQKKIIKIIKYPILSNPQFIAISPRGRIILSDILSNSVNIFSMEGSLRGTLGGPKDKDMFGEPRGIAFDKNGNLVVVCHKESGCLQIIDIDI